MIIRETSTSSFVELCDWCRDYHKNNIYPVSTERRFIIATYQLAQALGWESSYHNAKQLLKDYESFAAGALHFIMVAESFNLSVVNYEVFDIHDITTWPCKDIDYKHYTWLHGVAAQQLIYGARAKDTTRYQRGLRYNPDTLTKALVSLVTMLLCKIPSHQRIEAIEQASSIMTKKL